MTSGEQTNVRVARIALAEKALSYEHVEIDPFAPDMPTESLDLHPFRRVPTLVDGDFVLYDISTKLSPDPCCSQRNHVTAPEWCRSSPSSTPMDTCRRCGKSPESECLHPSESDNRMKR
jgi:hypothetical protein